MNWMRDNIGLSQDDLDRVFRYEPTSTTVLTKLASNNYETEIWSLQDETEWERWLKEDVPPSYRSDNGLVLVLAKRVGEPLMRGISKCSTSKWLIQATNQVSDYARGQKKDTFSPLEEKRLYEESRISTDMRRHVRILPFSREIYQLLAERLCIHGSIARVISRVDVPIFAGEKVDIGNAANVYNCRSSNAWDDDLALSATHFPDSKLTFAVLYGCPFHIEEDVIRRLSSIAEEATHPLLLPGIFAEIERARHVRLVEIIGNEIESRVFELNLPRKGLQRDIRAAERRNAAKRSAWLNLTYLKNGLVSWDVQLEKMISHWAEIDRHVCDMSETESKLIFPRICDGEYYSAKEGFVSGWCKSRDSSRHDEFCFEESLALTPTCSNVGRKIRNRLALIREEYDEKIRDCQMRLDGMAMMAQWSLGETNVEIALATSRDSRHMLSISLVTMVFLPGTFFASVFSMTFFDWSDKGTEGMISGYIWIYVLVTILFTLLTLGTWYYFVVLRHKQSEVIDEEGWRV